MKCLSVLLCVLFTILYFSQTDAYPYPASNPEMIAVSSESSASDKLLTIKINLQGRDISSIPQFHCLRYFKHDVNLLRRCRYTRFLRRPDVDEGDEFDGGN